ncbi:MAG: DUF4369 domain-containing protein [Prolixibacteraceae bacterium]|nr:DUF4369 domain-containing protein [Prolixibacteraceae bacterium]
MRVNKLFTILFFVLIISACSGDRFTVEGTVTDPLFRGEKVYLVALDGPVSRQVDSTLIREGKFRFSLKADSMEVRILRVAPKYPATIQDLVVIAEKGNLTASLGKVSRGGGTRLNDRLHSWKKDKEVHDSLLWVIYRQKEESTLHPALRDTLSARADAIHRSFREGNITLLEQNLRNGIGLLLFKLYFHDLPVEVKNRVMQETGDLYFRHDAELANQLRRGIQLPEKP